MPHYSFEDIRPPRRAKMITPRRADKDSIPSEDEDVSSVPVKNKEGVTKNTPATQVVSSGPLLLESHPIPFYLLLRRKSGLLMWGIGVLLVIVLGASIAEALGDARVVATLKKDIVPLDKPFVARMDGDKTDLSVSTMVVNDLAETVLVPTIEKAVNEKAKGTIIVYNAFDTNPQRLIKNTRFETPAGRIYRIQDSIIVPGLTKNGETVVPGSLEVVVVADEPGVAYNGPATDFTVPGFKGTPKFDKFYARSKGPLSGGFQGVRKEMTEQEIKDATLVLEKNVKEKLLARARAEKGDTTLLFEDGVSVVYEYPAGVFEDTSFRLAVKGTLTAFLFPGEAFARRAVRDIPSLATTPVSIKDISTAICSFPDKASFEKTKTLTVQCKGTVTLYRVLDTEAFKKKLENTPLSTLETLVKEFSAIETAEASISPFWRTKFPERGEDIEVLVKS